MLQLLTRPALDTLNQFNLNPTPRNASSLVNCPAVYNLLKFHEPNYPSSVLSVLKWLHGRGAEVLGRLIENAPSTQDQVINQGGLQVDPNEWKKVGLKFPDKRPMCSLINCRLEHATACLRFVTGQNTLT